MTDAHCDQIHAYDGHWIYQVELKLDLCVTISIMSAKW